MSSLGSDGETTDGSMCSLYKWPSGVDLLWQEARIWMTASLSKADLESHLILEGSGFHLVLVSPKICIVFLVANVPRLLGTGIQARLYRLSLPAVWPWAAPRGTSRPSWRTGTSVPAAAAGSPQQCELQHVHVL